MTRRIVGGRVKRSAAMPAPAYGGLGHATRNGHELLLVSTGPLWLTNVEHVGTVLADVAPDDPIDIGFRRERRGRLRRRGRLYAQ